jgi:hypothetical protein
VHATRLSRLVGRSGIAGVAPARGLDCNLTSISYLPPPSPAAAAQNVQITTAMADVNTETPEVAAPPAKVTLYCAGTFLVPGAA